MGKNLNIFPKTNHQQVQERHQTSLIIREMHIKTTMRIHFTPVRMATIKKTKCCQRCGTKGNFVYHCWDCEVIQPYGKQYGEPQKNLKYNYHILGIHPKEIKLVPWKEIGTLMFATLLLTIAKIWKQPNHPLMDTHSGTIFILQKKDFPSGPVAKTLHSQCRGPGFNPWSENWIPHTTTKDPKCLN